MVNATDYVNNVGIAVECAGNDFNRW